MGQTYTVTNASRKTKRDIEKVLGNDLRKYITELVTNSDDSYKRLAPEENIEDINPRPIYIEIDKTKKEIHVIDNAEGMDESSLKKNFEIYGDDKSGASGKIKVRGIFGQGASDVLFNAALNAKKSEIKTIKNNLTYICKFLFKDNKRNINIGIDKTHLKDVRNKFNIPDNGTIVYFGLPDKVSIPNDLFNKIKNFYMLRFILNNSERKIILRTKTKSKLLEKDLSYEFPIEENKLIEEPISFEYENNKITGLLRLFVVEQKDEEKYGDQKILVFDDEKSVYDNTFFEYGDKHPGIEKLFGYLELFDSSRLIREKLNQELPEEILSDTRDGFNKNHKFYENLNRVVSPLIGQALTIINSNKKEDIISLSSDKNWSNAFKEINKYFHELFEEEIGGVEKGTRPPLNGLEFVFPRIKITVGKKYSIQLLINTSLIKIGSSITIDSNNNKVIDINTNKILISNNDIKSDNLAIKNISIKGNEITTEDVEIIAKSDNGYESKLFVAVINKEIHYPKYGLEFWPNILVTKPELTSKIHLYFDINKFPLNSEVTFESTNDKILVDKKSCFLSKKNMISENVGVIENIILGSEDKIEGKLIATIKNYSTSMQLSVKNEETISPGTGGYFSGMDLDRLDGDFFYQSYFVGKTGKVMIKLNNSINKQQLGEIKENKFDIYQNKYLADLCSTECSKQIVIEKIKKGHIPGDDFESTYDELQKIKNKIFNLIYKIIS